MESKVEETVLKRKFTLKSSGTVQREHIDKKIKAAFRQRITTCEESVHLSLSTAKISQWADHVAWKKEKHLN